MDAFFASVEQLHHPEWRGKPVIVGSGPHERGVVSTCSYEARKFGVHSAMPSRTAYAKCPHAIFVKPNMALYQEVSAKVFEVFSHYSPFVEGVSIDEAFLDITGTLHLYGYDARRLGETLRAEVREHCGVTCSVGIAPNRLLAKIGSEQHKPDGLTLMPFEPAEIARFLADKPIGILWGVGSKTAETLRPFGIVRCGDVQKLNVAQLEAMLRSKAAAAQLADYAFGRDSSEVAWQDEDEKSVSREYTFDEDENDREKIRQRLIKIVGEVGQRFRRQTRWANTARLKLRDAKFTTFTRQLRLEAPARDDITLRKAALRLFEANYRTGTKIRLIGFGVSDFQTSPETAEMTLFGDDKQERRQRREKLSTAIDALKGKGFNITESAAQAPAP